MPGKIFVNYRRDDAAGDAITGILGELRRLGHHS
jgi:hypothetical protein